MDKISFHSVLRFEQWLDCLQLYGFYIVKQRAPKRLADGTSKTHYYCTINGKYRVHREGQLQEDQEPKIRTRKGTICPAKFTLWIGTDETCFLEGALSHDHEPRVDLPFPRLLRAEIDQRIKEGLTRKAIFGRLTAILWDRTSRAQTSADAYALWLEMIRNAVPLFEPSTFMVDDERAEHLAIRRIFPTAHVTLCWWHLKRARLRHVPKEDPNKLEEALDQLLNSENTSALMDNVLRVRERCTDKFWEYFIATYYGRFDMRVLYHRLHPRHNTNNYIKSWHAVVKAKFLERKVQRRLDTLLHILLGDIELRKFLEDAQWAARSTLRPNNEAGQLAEPLRARISGPMPVDDYIRAMSHEELVAAVLSTHSNIKTAVADAARDRALQRQINSPRQLMKTQEQ